MEIEEKVKASEVEFLRLLLLMLEFNLLATELAAISLVLCVT